MQVSEGQPAPPYPAAAAAAGAATAGHVGARQRRGQVVDLLAQRLDVVTVHLAHAVQPCARAP